MCRYWQNGKYVTFIPEGTGSNLYSDTDYTDYGIS
jgi:hypothetical protein